MAWIEVTEADLLTAISGAELTGYRGAALASGQSDPVDPTIQQVVDEVRGYVGGCAKNTLGPAGTIPSKLLSTALDLIVFRIPNRVGRDPKAGRDKAAENAMKRLEQVAACKFDIEEPVEPTDEVSSSAIRPSFSGRPRRNARRERDGL